MDQEELEMDQEESDQMDEGQIIEDMDAIDPRSAPTADIVQIAVAWATKMAAQPNGFVIGEGELVEAIVEAATLSTAAKIAEDDLGEDDEDVGEDIDQMDDDDEIAVDLPEEMTCEPDDDIPPYESGQLFILDLTDKTCCPLFEDHTISY